MVSFFVYGLRNLAGRLPTRKGASGYGLLLAFCCLCFRALAGDEISRTYDYKGTETNDAVLVDGTITLHLDETNQAKGVWIKVTGEWTLHMADTNRIKLLGPQDGTGKIVGRTRDDVIFLNLNPDPASFGDNVYLDGKITRGEIFVIKGKWQHIGFYAGKISEGNFEMTRKDEPPKPPEPPPPPTTPATP